MMVFVKQQIVIARHLTFGRFPAWVNAYIPEFIRGPTEEKKPKSIKVDDRTRKSITKNTDKQ